MNAQGGSDAWVNARGARMREDSDVQSIDFAGDLNESLNRLWTVHQGLIVILSGHWVSQVKCAYCRDKLHVGVATPRVRDGPVTYLVTIGSVTATYWNVT